MNGRVARKIRKSVWKHMWNTKQNPTRRPTYSQVNGSTVCTGYKAVVKLAKKTFRGLNRLQKKAGMVAIRTV